MKNKITLIKVFPAIISHLGGRSGFFLLLIILLPMLAHAQPPDVGGDVDAPIDGGLSLLVAAGVGYGAKKLKGKKECK